MEVKTITITAEASKAYQKYCVALTAESIEGDEDINTLKQIAISKAMEGIEELAGCIGTPEVKVSTTTVQQRSAVRANPVQNTYNAQRNVAYQNQGGFQQRPQYQAKPVSEAQIKYITGLGYQGQIPQTWDQANQLLQQLKAERGIQ